MNYVIGIDTGSESIHYQIETWTGHRIDKGKVPKNGHGWSELKQCMSNHKLAPEQTLVVIEATGRHHLPWCERLHRSGFLVYALNPLLSKRLYSTKNAIRDNKDDALDAETLAEIGRIHHHKLERFGYRPQCGRLRLQSLVSARKAIREQCTNLLKSAGDLFQTIYPEIASGKLNLTHSGLRALLLEAPTPQALKDLPEQRLRQRLGSKAEVLRQALALRICTDQMVQSCSPALIAMIETIEALLEKLKDLEASIEDCIKQDPTHHHNMDLLRSLPGFGAHSSAVIAAFLPMDIFQSGNKKNITARLQAYLGVDPRRRKSGKYQGKVKISKRGIEIARTALFQASFCGICHDPELKAYYDKKKAEGDHHKKAVVDLMRKNLRRIVSVLVSQQPFTPHYQNG